MRTTAHSRAALDLAKIDWAKIDATSDEEIDAQIAADADTAPSFTAGEILAAGRSIDPESMSRLFGTDWACHRRPSPLGMDFPSVRSGNMNGSDASPAARFAPC